MARRVQDHRVRELRRQKEAISRCSQGDLPLPIKLPVRVGAALGTPGPSGRPGSARPPPGSKELSVLRNHGHNQRGGAAGQSRLQRGQDAPAPVPRPAAGGAAAPDPRAREGPRGRAGRRPPQGARRPATGRRGLRAPRTWAARRAPGSAPGS